MAIKFREIGLGVQESYIEFTDSSWNISKKPHARKGWEHLNLKI